MSSEKAIEKTEIDDQLDEDTELIDPDSDLLACPTGGEVRPSEEAGGERRRFYFKYL